MSFLFQVLALVSSVPEMTPLATSNRLQIDLISAHETKKVSGEWQKRPMVYTTFLPLDEATASRAVFVIVSVSDGQADGNAF